MLGKGAVTMSEATAARGGGGGGAGGTNKLEDAHKAGGIQASKGIVCDQMRHGEGATKAATAATRGRAIRSPR
jgi:hypothetical protein